ncbi:MAG: DNA repair and recombination protein RadB [Nanoarchaeota archaeon]|nr:DNA repair and recombination protein RadB [Nanoarchaeota archaeon]MBU1270439.1 DNA repair and recombination protein RadB [Nanoarchaeota archaeon]MBU1604800.1 DNA repair and recombination protein RadB [Nanoarchaeota archaeon]MBU2443214.1 DNA repair and recombination protein RadB [Nanoarchaeota archaeon]
MDKKIRTGSLALDKMLAGGYETGVLTTIYGPAGSGKTNLCLMAMAAFSSDKKMIYIDTEGSFSVDRIKQITPQHEQLMSKTIFFKPTNFKEQKDLFTKLKTLIDESIGLIIFDSVAMLYRLEMGKNKDVYNVNKELGIQLSYLTEIARKMELPVLITNQVYSDFENKDQIKMVGGDILKYSSKCLLELQVASGFRRVVLRKHRSLPDGKKLLFKIVNQGIEEINEKTIPQ